MSEPPVEQPGVDDAAPPGRPRQRKRRVAWWLALAATALIITTLTIPTQMGLAGTWPIAPLISFRSLLGVVLAAIAAPLVLVAVATSGVRRRRAMAFAVLLALGAGGQWAILTTRTAVSETTPAAPDALTVVTMTAGTKTKPAAIAQYVAGNDASIVALPETSETIAREVADLLAEDGQDMNVFGVPAPSGPGSSSLLIDSDLGTYSIAELGPTKLRSFVVTRTGDGTGPVAVGVVAAVKPTWPTSMSSWRATNNWAVRACHDYPGIVIAGDFAATVDHPALSRLGHCEDAATQAGQETAGTWPANLPMGLASPVDHVLVDGRTWWVTSLVVDDPTPGSHHRPLLAKLTSRIP